MADMLFSLLIAVLIYSLGITHAIPVQIKPEVATEFIILHNNDMHGRFEQITADSGKCRGEIPKTNKCYGGFARVAHVVRKYREEAKNGGTPVLYLNAGDTFTGTLWFAIHKHEIASTFLNKLQPDAISLGNHEFDHKVPGLIPFLDALQFPVVAANFDMSDEPRLRNAKNLFNSTVLDVNGVKVGVIGYLTPETLRDSKTNGLKIFDEVEAINQESSRLKQQGVNIIIALGHSGYTRDQQIAKLCSDVDLVIGGHTNTFLYNGESPDTEKIDGPYPTVIKQASGKEVPVVQAYAHTKYLGKLRLQFDKEGNLINFDGSPILLNDEIPRDEDILELLDQYRDPIEKLDNDIVGRTKVKLIGLPEKCRSQECNLGNLIADAMIHARVNENMGGIYWTDAAIAFVPSGSFRNSITPYGEGLISAADILNVLAHNNTLYVTETDGKTIRAALEHSASVYNKDEDGGFLQMSGVHTIYDYNKPEGSRVLSVEVLCANCSVPTYDPLIDSMEYKVILPDYLLNGGDGHPFRKRNEQLMKLTQREALIEYLKTHQIVYPAVEGRISIIHKTESDENRVNENDQEKADADKSAVQENQVNENDSGVLLVGEVDESVVKENPQKENNSILLVGDADESDVKENPQNENDNGVQLVGDADKSVVKEIRVNENDNGVLLVGEADESVVKENPQIENDNGVLLVGEADESVVEENPQIENDNGVLLVGEADESVVKENSQIENDNGVQLVGAADESPVKENPQNENNSILRVGDADELDVKENRENENDNGVQLVGDADESVVKEIRVNENDNGIADESAVKTEITQP